VKAVQSTSNVIQVGGRLEEDLWWEGLLEKVCLEFRVEVNGSYGWRVVVMEQVGLGKC